MPEQVEAHLSGFLRGIQSVNPGVVLNESIGHHTDVTYALMCRVSFALLFGTGRPTSRKSLTIYGNPDLLGVEFAHGLS